MGQQERNAESLLRAWKGDRYAHGVGVLDQVGAYAARFGKRTMLVVTQYGEEGGKWFGPYLGDITRSLAANGVDYGEPVKGAGPNAPREDVYRIALAVAKIRPDSIIAVGGGSTIDAGKAASVLVSYQGSDIEPYFGVGQVTEVSRAQGNPMIPVIAVQTAASSGAHLTKYSNITDPAKGIKKLIVDEAIIPAAAVFDYRVTQGAPISLTLDGGLDGIAHCWEVFIGATGKAYYQEIREITETSIRLIAANLPRAMADPNDLDARVALGLGTDLGGYAIMIGKVNARTGQMERGGTNAGHLGSFQLTPYLAHGRACAVLNPYYVVLFADAIEPQNRTVGAIFQEAGFIAGNVNLGELGGRGLAEVVAEGMIAFSRIVGFPTTLEEAGVPEAHIAVMVEAAKNPQLKMKLQNMPSPMDVERGDVDRLMRPTLEAAYRGDLSLIP
ncbi:MAG: iron-containing alcohol dehydrogenase [Candidatus Latescibacterota bacterium]